MLLHHSDKEVGSMLASLTVNVPLDRVSLELGDEPCGCLLSSLHGQHLAEHTSLHCATQLADDKCMGPGALRIVIQVDKVWRLRFALLILFSLSQERNVVLFLLLLLLGDDLGIFLSVEVVELLDHLIEKFLLILLIAAHGSLQGIDAVHTVVVERAVVAQHRETLVLWLVNLLALIIVILLAAESFGL